MGTAVLPRRPATRIQLVAGVLLVVLAVAGAAAVRVHGAVAGPASDAAPQVTTATSTTIVAAPEPAGPGPAAEAFTLGDLAAGRVPQDVQDRFWQGQLDAILAAPCPPATTPGATAVTLFVGADADWTERLSDATAAKHADCAG